MAKIVKVKSIPPFEGQKVGAVIEGYEKLGYTRAPGTFDTKKAYIRDGKLDTGMLYKVPNPLYEEVPNPNYKEGSKEPKSIPKDPNIPSQIWKWEEMEMKLGIKKTDSSYNVSIGDEDVDRGFYSTSLSPNSRFFNYFSVRLKAGENKFDIENPKEELKLLVLKGTHEVLPTLSMRNLPEYKGANFYIEDIEMEAESKLTKGENKLRAFEEYSASSFEMKKRFANILGIIKSASPSDKVINGVLFEYIDTSEPNRKAFLRVVDKYKSQPDFIIAQDEFLQAKNAGIIRKIDGKYYKMSPDGRPGRQIGVDEDTSIQFILDIQNNEFRAELKEAVRDYKGITVNA
jgi:hypothetical protein